MRKDCNRYGGGICVYIKDHINFRVRHDLLTNDTEAIAVEVIKTNSKLFAMIIGYRVPDCNPDIFFNHISNAIKVLDYKSKEI